jgi:nucleotide-binding universal stress UspA family protein
MFTRILVPTDFSEPSDAALDYARAMAAKFGSTLQLLHVVEAPFVSGPFASEVYVSEMPAVQMELFEDAKARLGHRLTPSDRARLHATSEIICGGSARSIIDYAAERGIDLIVMGTHGRSGMAHLLMGSVAEKVVRGAPCPVLTVRTAPAAAELPIAAGTGDAATA